jgi:ATP-binding cassette subfamily B protein
MTMSHLLTLSWAYRISLGICLFFMIGETAAALTIPWLGGQLASSVLSEGSLAIGPLAATIVAILAIQTALRITSRLTLASTSEHIVASLRKDLYDHLQSLPIGFFQARRQGDILALLTREIEQLANFMTGTLIGLIPQALTFIGALILIVQIDLLLALPIIFGIPLFFLALKLVGRRLRPLAGDLRDAYADTIAVAEQNLSMLPAIKSFTREDLEAARYHDSTDRLRDIGIRLARIQTCIGPLLHFVAAVAVVGLVCVASTRIHGDSMAPAKLVALLLYAALLTRPISALADSWGQFQCGPPRN